MNEQKLMQIHSIILNALDRDAAEGRLVRGEMASILREAIAEDQPEYVIPQQISRGNAEPNQIYADGWNDCVIEMTRGKNIVNWKAVADEQKLVIERLQTELENSNEWLTLKTMECDKMAKSFRVILEDDYVFNASDTSGEISSKKSELLNRIRNEARKNVFPVEN